VAFSFAFLAMLRIYQIWLLLPLLLSIPSVTFGVGTSLNFLLLSLFTSAGPKLSSVTINLLL
jgi:hypothetical protein